MAIAMRVIPKQFSSSQTARTSLRVAVGVLCLGSASFVSTGCVSQSLTGLTIQPGTGLTCVIPGVSAQYKAYGTYTESGHATRTQDITDEVTWSATIPAVAAINSTGLATGMGLGSTSLLATAHGAFGNLTATSNIEVESSCTTTSVAKPLALSIVAGSETLHAAGESAQFLAMGTYSAAPLTADQTHAVSWKSSNVKVATVDAAGMVTAVGPGEATITAEEKGADGNLVSASREIQFTTGPAEAEPLQAFAVYGPGAGNGHVMGTAVEPDGTSFAIDCAYHGTSSAPGAGSGCSSTLPLGTVVTLRATQEQGTAFDGWSKNCSFAAGDPSTCSLTINNNGSVGAIFDPQ